MELNPIGKCIDDIRYQSGEKGNWAVEGKIIYVVLLYWIIHYIKFWMTLCNEGGNLVLQVTVWLQCRHSGVCMMKNEVRNWEQLMNVQNWYELSGVECFVIRRRELSSFPVSITRLKDRRLRDDNKGPQTWGKRVADVCRMPLLLFLLILFAFCYYCIGWAWWWCRLKSKTGADPWTWLKLSDIYLFLHPSF